MKRILLLPLIFLLSCDDDLPEIQLVYENDFDSGNLDNVVGGVLHTYDDNQMLGNYNNDGFAITLGGLDKHHSIMIAFDLYIHDSWDGNAGPIGGPDLWTIQVNQLARKKEITTDIFSTTFSNSVCNSTLCRLQSYPQIYPFNNGPRSGTSEFLPGLCHFADQSNGTSLYQIEQFFDHQGEGLAVRFFDELVQTNVPDVKCDESWSLDNLRIWTLNTK